MERVSFRQSAAPGERFAPDAFASSIGKTSVLNVGVAQRAVVVTLTGAEVAKDGSSAWLTVELPEGEHIGLNEVFPTSTPGGPDGP